MRTGVVATLAAALTACSPAAASTTSEWSASGSLSGTYANRITWVACQGSGATATTRENLTLDARIAALHPTPYAHGAIVLSMTMAPHPGGSWTVDGSVPPLVDQVNPDTGADLRGRARRPARIEQNLLVVTAAADHIAPPDGTVPLLDLVASEDVTHFDRPGGHIGLMAGSKASTQIWPELADWLRERSGH